MKNPIIRKIYLYLFSLVGLIMLLFGVGSLVNIGLKTFIFTKADLDLYTEPITLGYYLEPREQMEAIQKCEIAETDKEIISQWLVNYEKNKDIDVRIIERQEDASDAIAKIIVGFPVYLYHWGVITRDRKRRKDNV
tara:strand:- start:12 stop:419 length:408 start_codon:yes stop_codon:yes gene_type:complete